MQQLIIVSTSSGNGDLWPLRGLPVYAASKNAVSQISECLCARGSPDYMIQERALVVGGMGNADE